MFRTTEDAHVEGLAGHRERQRLPSERSGPPVCDRVRTAALDVVDDAAAYTAVQVAVDGFGRLDVVVNNAGYGDIAPFEQLRLSAIQDGGRHQLLWRGECDSRGAADHATATERLRPPDIVGRRPLGPSGSAAYHAASGRSGFTEALAQKVAPFAVRVCALEPGGMRTNWGARANQDTPDSSRTTKRRRRDR
jgi:NAD(P)-dependent dehydrogenase (short-subunit alcohol dehydrogenase family)